MTDPNENTIADFGEQWTRYRENKDYYGSVTLLQDILGPLVDITAISGCRVADIGSGTGRIVMMLIAAGAAEVTAIEPSRAFDVLRENTKAFSSKIKYIKARGEAIPPNCNFDFIFSIGVLHHIIDPDPIVGAAHNSLRPGGRLMIWLYGKEGNGAYLCWALPLRKVARKIPDGILAGISCGLNILLTPYIWLCRVFPLPMRYYMRSHMAKLSWQARYLTIFDQLNPAYARYYTETEARNLLERAGFQDVRLFHRHGYSWSVIGTRSP